MFPLKTRGGKDTEFPTEVRTMLKNQGGHVPKKHTQEASFIHKGRDISARRQDTHKAGEHSEFLIPALSAP